MESSRYEKFKEQLFEALWRDLDPLEEEIENNEQLPYDRLIPLLKQMRAFGLIVPEKYGGVGLSMSQYMSVLAEFAKIQGGIRVLVHVHNTTAHAISDLATEEQKSVLLPGCAEGRLSVAFGLTEPEFGSGAGIGTTADRHGDEYVLNGRKWLITNSDLASHFIIFAKTPSETGQGVTAILVERETPGFSIEPLPETMGCKGGQHGQLTLEDVRVPVSNVLGAPGRGLDQMEKALEISRVFIAATSLGTAERSLELSLIHARKRVTFGKPIAERQAIQRYLAEMATDIYALRGMLADASAKWDRGLRIPAEASMCKLFGLEAVGRVTDRALLIHGGIGYTRQLPIERLYRDARLNYLEEGTPTIQYMVAATALLAGYDWNR